MLKTTKLWGDEKSGKECVCLNLWNCMLCKGEKERVKTPATIGSSQLLWN